MGTALGTAAAPVCAVMIGPRVSVVIPCLNEAQHLPALLERLAAQASAVPAMELIVVDGGSTDGTPALAAQWQAAHPAVPLRLLHNPAGHIPHALNQGIATAAGAVIIRLDGHARPAPDYVRQCLRVMEETGAAVVGGQWRVCPGGPGRAARAIALAVSSPLGAGDARYRLPGAPAGPVDTVPFGCFRRQTWADLGRYNEELLTNEDYEFNARVRAGGGTVYFDPRIQCEYFARPCLRALARQYWRYGWWKAQMLKRHRGSLRWRQALPLVWSVGGLLALPLALLGPGAAALVLGVWAAYLALLAAEAARLAWGAGDWALGPPLVAAFILIHFSWGLGAALGLVRRQASGM